LSIDKLKNMKIVDNGTQALILRIIRDLNPISRSGIVEKTTSPSLKQKSVLLNPISAHLAAQQLFWMNV